jgi:ATP-dependent protease HslVU (ClpYQ) peptidase subunit
MVSSVHLGSAKETETDPRLVELLDEVDRLLKGHIEDRKAAYNLLLEHEDEVCFHNNKSVCIVMKIRDVYVHMNAKNVFGCDQSHIPLGSTS